MRARLIYVVFALVALAFPALAEDRRGGGSLDRVLPEIRRSVPGTFYDAEGPFLTADGRATYHVKWMTPDGRIIWFTVDARSGQIMGGPPSNSRIRHDGNAGWGDRRNNFGNDDRRGWNNDRGGDGDWGNNRGNDGGHDRGGWGNGRGGHGNGHDRGGRGGGDHRHGG